MRKPYLFQDIWPPSSSIFLQVTGIISYHNLHTQESAPPKMHKMRKSGGASSTFPLIKTVSWIWVIESDVRFTTWKNVKTKQKLSSQEIL